MGEPMTLNPSGYTQGEIKAIIAPILGISSEDIDGFIILTKGRCEHCNKRDGYTTLDNVNTTVEYIGIINQAMDLRIEKDIRDGK